MSEGINAVLLQGEICWPELKYTGTGKALFKSKIKISTVDSRSGDPRDSFMRITAWEELAEALNALPARSKVRVSGRIQERSFTTREGQKRNVTDIVIDGMEAVESEEGENRFILQGEIVWPELKQVGQNSSNLFKSKLKIPYERDGQLRHSYVKVTAWDDNAAGLGELGEGVFVKVSGHIQDRTWVDPEGQKRVFTDAVVTNWNQVDSEATGAA